MYIMFPIGFMYYFGINLDSRFAVPDFWPKRDETHQIPFEREEIAEELQRLKHKRLAARARRLAIEEMGGSAEVTENRDRQIEQPREEILSATKVVPAGGQEEVKQGAGKGWFGWGK
jgi:protein PET100